MSETPEPPETRAALEDPPPKKKPAPVPAALGDFLLEKKASASRFVQSLASRPQLTEDDLTRSHEILRDDPTKIAKVVDLARAAALMAPQPALLLRWCDEVLRSRDETLRTWGLDPNESVTETFDGLLKNIIPRIGSKNKRTERQLGEACLTLGLALLLSRRSLAPLDALRSLSSARARRRESRRDSSADRDASKLLLRASTKQLFDLARITALSDAETVAARAAQRNAEDSLNKVLREKEELETAADQLKLKIEQLDQELNKQSSRVVAITADLEAARTRALHDLRNLKARFRRQIGERLLGLLNDAWDAMDTTPPHPNVAKERLEVARAEIQGELQWLDKSSD